MGTEGAEKGPPAAVGVGVTKEPEAPEGPETAGEPEAEAEAVGAEVSTETMDIPTTLIWATAALTRERPKAIDFMMT